MWQGSAKRLLPFLAVAILAFAVAAWALPRSSVFQICTDTQTYDQHYDQHYGGGKHPQDARGIPDYLECAAAAADANDNLIVAFGTILIAAFTGTLWWATNKLWIASEKQIRVAKESAEAAMAAAGAAYAQVATAHKQFIATHRPRISIRLVQITSQPQEPLKVQFTLANSGLTGADIEECRVDLVVDDKPPYPDDKAGVDVTGPLPLEPGPSIIKDFTKQGLTKASLTVQFMQTKQDGIARNLYFAGVVLYKDRNNTHHRKAFCRLYDPESGRFGWITQPDYEEYEYED